MTNHDDMDPHSPHEHEADQAFGGEEAYTGEEPPLDDFGDTHGEGEGAATMDAEGEAIVHEHSDQSLEEKKNKMLLPMAAVAGGMLIIIAVLFWVFEGTRNRDTVPMQVAQVQAAPRLSNDVPAQAPAVMGEPTTPTTNLVPPSTVAPPVAELPTPAAPVAVDNTDARLTTLSNRMDDMQHSIEQAMLKLSQVSDKLSNMPATAPAVDPTVDDRLSKIEQKLNQLEQRPTRTVSAAPAPSHRRHVASHPSHGSHNAMGMAEKPSKGGWVLRAASPDEAWVAKNAGTDQLRAVHVGDVLPGIGRVNSIQDRAGNWTVHGSFGNVTE